MRISRMCVLVAVGIFALSSSGYAQDDARKPLAEELLRLMEIDRGIEKTFEMMKQMQTAQINSIQLPGEVSEEDKEKIAAMQSDIMDMMVKEMSWEALKDDFVAIYADVFSKEELEGIIAFYKTPVGQKFVKKQPELMQESMQISQKRMVAIMPKMQKMMQEMREALKK